MRWIIPENGITTFISRNTIFCHVIKLSFTLLNDKMNAAVFAAAADVSDGLAKDVQ